MGCTDLSAMRRSPCYTCIYSGVHITGTQVRMRGHNRGCVTSLVSLQRFCVTYGRSKEKRNNKIHWAATCAFATCKEKANGARAEENVFLRNSGTKMCRGSKRMISAMKCALMCAVQRTHTGELRKISWSQRSFCQIIKRSVVELLQFDKKKRWRKKPLWNWLRFIRSDVTCGAMSGVRTKHHLLVLNWVTL